MTITWDAILFFISLAMCLQILEWLTDFFREKLQPRSKHAWQPFLVIGLVIAGLVTITYDAVRKEQLSFDEGATKLAGLTFAIAVCLTFVLLVLATRLTKRFSKTWVKFLDYPYIILAFGGLLRVLNSAPNAAARMEQLDAIGVVAVACALGIRLSKATLEVFFERWVSGELNTAVDEKTT